VLAAARSRRARLSVAGAASTLTRTSASTPPLPTAVVRRGDRSVFYRTRRQRAADRLRLFRGRARSPGHGQAPHPRRSAAHHRQHRQAAGAAETGVVNRTGRFAHAFSKSSVIRSLRSRARQSYFAQSCLEDNQIARIGSASGSLWRVPIHSTKGGFLITVAAIRSAERSAL
jgi:hypothetical protein